MVAIPTSQSEKGALTEFAKGEFRAVETGRQRDGLFHGNFPKMEGSK